VHQTFQEDFEDHRRQNSLDKEDAVVLFIGFMELEIMTTVLESCSGT
jgi:hypothetical protein